MEFDYHDFRNNFVKNDIMRELDVFDKIKLGNDEYLDFLKSRVCNDIEKFNPKINNEIDDDYFNSIQRQGFKKSWAKMNMQHKIIKLEEYVNNLKYDNKLSQQNIEKNKKYLIKKILSNINHKYIKKNVEYDIENMIITDADFIIWNKKKKCYIIDFE